jgi:hypothetical protein
MENNRTGRRTPMFMGALAVFCAATVLGAAIAGGLWLRPTDGGGWQAFVAAAALALTSVLVIVWQSRARGTKQWRATLEAYAEREIAQDRRRKAPPTAA